MSEPKRRKTSHNAAPATQLPVLEDFDSVQSIVSKLSTRDSATLTAALVLLEKHALSACSKDAAGRAQDHVWQYLLAHPTVDHVYSAWDTANRANNSQLATAVINALAALTRLSSCSSKAKEPELLRRLVSQYGSHLERSFNPGRNDVTTAALKLCILVVSYGNGRFAKRLLRCMSWSPKVTSRLYKTRLKDTSKSPLHRPDIRTLLVMLVLALLNDGDSKFRIEVIETKGLMSGMLKGLSDDRDIVIKHVLTCLWKNVLSDRSIKLDTRRSLIDEGFINEIVKLLDKGEDDEASVSAQRFLYTVATWLCDHVHETQGRAFASQRILGTVVRSLKVTEDSTQRELALHIFHSCPLLVASYWSRFPAAFEARLSSRWVSAITFATRIISTPIDFSLSLEYGKGTVPTATSILDSLRPPQLTKQWYSKALQSDSALVSFLAALCLLASLQKANLALDAIANNIESLEESSNGRWTALARSFRNELQQAMPEPQVVIALIQKETSKKDTSDHFANLRINAYLRIVWMYHRVVPDMISSLRFDYAKLSDFISDDVGDEVARSWSASYALRLSSLHSPSLTWSRPNEYYKVTLAPLIKLLRVTKTDANRRLLVDSLKRLLNSQILFRSDNHDIDTVLSVLYDADSALVDCFDRCLQHSLARAANLSGFMEDTSKNDLSPCLVSALHLAQHSQAGEPDSEGFARYLSRLFFAFARSTSHPQVLHKVAEGVREHADVASRLKRALAVLVPNSVGSTGDTKSEKKRRSSGISSAPAAQSFTAQSASDEDTETLMVSLIGSSAESDIIIKPIIEQRQQYESACLLILRRLLDGPRSDPELDRLSTLLKDLLQRATPDQRLQVASIAFDSMTIDRIAPRSADTKEGIERACVLFGLFVDGLEERDVRRVAASLLQRVSEQLETLNTSDQAAEKLLSRIGPVLRFLPTDLTDRALSVVLSSERCSTQAIQSLLSARGPVPTSPTTTLPKWLTTESLSRLLGIVYDDEDHFGIVADTIESFATQALPTQQLQNRESAVLMRSILGAVGSKVATLAELTAKLPRLGAACVYSSTNAAKALGKAKPEWKTLPEQPIVAYLDVETSRGASIDIPDDVIADLVGRAISTRNSDLVVLLCRACPRALDQVKTQAQDLIASTPRDDYDAPLLRFFMMLAQQQTPLSSLPEDVVNNAFAGLVRRFAEDEEDTDRTRETVRQLTAIATECRDLSFKAHLLDPLMTATLTRRLDQVLPVRMARCLADIQQWSENEASRHLNAIFASKHYQLLTTAASEDFEDLKTELKLLIVQLARHAPSALQTSRCIERVMPLYGGSLSKGDQAVFELLKSTEATGSNVVAQYAKLFKPSPDAPTFDEGFAARLASVQSDMMIASWRHASGARVSSIDTPAKVYDSRFLLPYCLSTLSADSLDSKDWTTILTSNVLGVAFAALSNSDPDMRSLAKAVLSLAKAKIEMSRLAEKDEVVLLIDAAKNCMWGAESEPVPSITAMFFAHCSHFIARPESLLYPQFVRFLLQRAEMDQRDVPMFYLSLFSSGEKPQEDHQWLVSYLSEGLVRSQDWRILRRRQVFELLASFFAVQPVNGKLRRSILRFCQRAAEVRLAAYDLVNRHAFFDWIRTQRLSDAEAVQAIETISMLVTRLSLSKTAPAAGALAALDVVSRDHPAAVAAAFGSLSNAVSLILTLLVDRASPSELAAHLPPAVEVVTRLSVALVSSAPEQPRQQFYTAAMLLAYAHSKTGDREPDEVGFLFRKAVQVGYGAGLAQLRSRVVDSFCQ